MPSFLKYRHPHVAATEARWQLCKTFYTGEGAASYLVRHEQGESSTSFEERARLAQFVPYVSTVIDTLAGVLFERESDVVRSWGFLGDPDTPGTEAYRLSRDTGGGLNYGTMLRRTAIDLLLYNEIFLLIDGEQVRTLSPLSVPNYLERNGRIESALVREVVDTRTSITEEPETIDQFVLYEPEGWTRYREDKGAAVAVSSGRYSESGRMYVDRTGAAIPPLVRVALPWRRYVAYMLAESARVLYNMESDRDSLLRSASYPKLVISGDDDHFIEQAEGLKKGSNVLQRLEEYGDHSYIAPPTGGIEVAGSTLRDKQADFYRHAWDLISAEGQVQKTATQVALERSAGLSSALSMIAATMEEIESNVLWLLAQSLSDRLSDWSSLTADWSGVDYSQVSIEMPQTA